MKFKLNRAFREASGSLDDLTFRTVNGKVIACRRADRSKTAYSENQIAARERFKEAAAYGRGAMNDEDARQMYQAAARERELPVYAVMIADYFNAPVIGKVNTDAYNGHANQVIQVTASDDFGVVRVQVKISGPSGNVIESGEAFNSGNGAGPWTYVTQNSTDDPVIIQVVATDRPGGTAVMNIEKSF